MRYPPKTLPFLSYDDATKNAINKIAHILHKSTSQPRLQILPLPPLLPQTQNVNLQLQNIPRIPVPYTSVEAFSQPIMVKILQSAPTTPTRLQPFT